MADDIRPTIHSAAEAALYRRAVLGDETGEQNSGKEFGHDSLADHSGRAAPLQRFADMSAQRADDVGGVSRTHARGAGTEGPLYGLEDATAEELAEQTSGRSHGIDDESPAERTRIFMRCGGEVEASWIALQTEIHRFASVLASNSLSPAGTRAVDIAEARIDDWRRSMEDETLSYLGL